MTWRMHLARWLVGDEYRIVTLDSFKQSIEAAQMEACEQAFAVFLDGEMPSTELPTELPALPAYRRRETRH
jgi:hypothetical protein